MALASVQASSRRKDFQLFRSQNGIHEFKKCFGARIFR